MFNWAFLSIISAIFSLFSIFIVILIFKKLYQENYRKPWIYIALSAISFAVSQIVTYLYNVNNILIYDLQITEFIIYSLHFATIAFLSYGLLLEYLMLTYIKGKFVKMKFVPVQEGSLNSKLNIDVDQGNGYFAFKKDRDFLFKEFSIATKTGFEGFLLAEDSPKTVRDRYKLQVTPLAWITKIDKNIESDYINKNIDENSDIVNPTNLNSIVNYIDSFLQQSTNPFVVLELNLILKENNTNIVIEFIEYLKSRIQRYNGIFIFMLNIETIEKEDINKIKDILKTLD